MPRFVYLHGFASSPLSRKAQFFNQKLAGRGIPLEIPALEQDDFEHLTLSSQLALLTRLLQGSPATLIGSSMGGFLAALYASMHPEVDRLVLLAPAFGFASRWVETFGEAQVTEWRTKGYAEIYHYATKSVRPLSADLLHDAPLHPEYPSCTQPTLIFHGRKDTVVPIQAAERWVAANPQAQLVPLDSDHELPNALEDIWYQTERFLLP